MTMTTYLLCHISYFLNGPMSTQHQEKIEFGIQQNPSECSQEPHDRPKVFHETKLVAQSTPSDKKCRPKETTNVLKIKSFQVMSDDQWRAAEVVAHKLMREEGAGWSLTRMEGTK